ncbi:MAG: LysR family transcriptional regulator [Alphaproteobacteria bacterium]|nr:LysR family transcriptional regulator [Alphaproteobacteria bacterium]
MTLKQLQIFLSASRHLNLSNAALELDMSQPAVSLQMRQLQEELGISLYSANNRGIELTQDGQDFAAAIAPPIEELGRVERRFKSPISANAGNHLTIGGTHTLTEAVLLEHLVRFRKKHQNVRVILETGSSPEIEEGVRNATVDIGLISGPSYFDECEYEEFGNQEMVAFVPQDDPLGGHTLSLDALMREPLVTKKNGTCVKRLLRMGLNPNLALECMAGDSVKAGVIRGLGVGLLFRSRIEEELRRQDFRLINVPELRKLSRRSFLVYRRRDRLSKAGRDFLLDLQGRSSALSAEAVAT